MLGPRTPRPLRHIQCLANPGCSTHGERMRVPIQGEETVRCTLRAKKKDLQGTLSPGKGYQRGLVKTASPNKSTHQLTVRREARAVSSWGESESEVTQSCPTPCDPMDCSPPGSSAHGVLQARILEWVAIPISRASSWPRDRTYVSCASCIRDKRSSFFTH